jgi:hypothetical protein
VRTSAGVPQLRNGQLAIGPRAQSGEFMGAWASVVRPPYFDLLGEEVQRAGGVPFDMHAN